MAQTTVPGHMIREMRQRTLAKVTSAIQSNFGSGYRIEVFGSTQYGVDGQTSDLDLVVIVSLHLSSCFVSRVEGVSGPG
jgi:DNA polymerase sigma